jgi:hypothetical protein
MSEYELHVWGKDELTKFLEHAHTNSLAFFEENSGDAALLIRVDAAYRERIASLPLIGATEDEAALALRIFLFMAHSAYLAATRLCSSGQLAEAYALIRACLERALYASFLAKNHEARAAWFERAETTEARKRSKQLLKVSDMIRTLPETGNDATATEVQSLYDAAIDHGAHPNVDDVRSNMARWKQGEEPLFGRRYLHWQSTARDLCIARCAASGVHVLSILDALLCLRFNLPRTDATMALCVETANIVHARAETFAREMAG